MLTMYLRSLQYAAEGSCISSAILLWKLVGVFQHGSSSRPWRVMICSPGNDRILETLGAYVTPEEAAHAYDE